MDQLLFILVVSPPTERRLRVKREDAEREGRGDHGGGGEGGAAGRPTYWGVEGGGVGRVADGLEGGCVPVCMCMHVYACVCIGVEGSGVGGVADGGVTVRASQVKST